MIGLERKGFTLVEIMIVVAIIALLAAIAIPNLLRARLNANETAAIAAMRTLSTALESYRATQTPPTYPTTAEGLAKLGPGVGGSTPPYIDGVLSAAVSTTISKQGYYYTYALVNANQYDLAGSPATSGTTGNRYFYVNEAGVIYAGITSPTRAVPGTVIE